MAPKYRLTLLTKKFTVLTSHLTMGFKIPVLSVLSGTF
jgi:hypothetical protein